MGKASGDRSAHQTTTTKNLKTSTVREVANITTANVTMTPIAVTFPSHAIARTLILVACSSFYFAWRFMLERGSLLGIQESLFAETTAATNDSYSSRNQFFVDENNVITKLFGEQNKNDQQIDDDAVLPSCKSIMQNPRSTPIGSDFLTSPETLSGWTLRDDGSREYNLKQNCSLHRYTAQEARECLIDKHIMFIGDSLTRFQVTSLVHLLERGAYPHRFDRSNRGVCWPYGAPPNGTESTDIYEQCSPKDRPNVCVADDFRNAPFGDTWSSFHHQIGGATDGGVFRGRMECDCIRGGLNCHNDRLGCDVENFFYASEPLIKEKPTIISFFFESGWVSHPRPIKGFNFTGCALTGSCRYNETVANEKRVNSYNGTYNFYQPLGDALERNGSLWQVIPPVDVSIYNRGLWGALTTEQATRYMPLFRDLTSQKQNGQCFFKSTTGSARTSAMSFQHEQTTLRHITRNAGCSFLDMAHITKDFGSMSERLLDGETNWERPTIYQDGIHFRPWVYEEFNNVLLNVLCNSH
jgi:hypothetical protein